MEVKKVKPLTKDQLIISIDRLTRFKNTETKYLRVFKDVIMSNLITPKYKKSDLEKIDYEELKLLAEYIINYSISQFTDVLEDDFIINQRLYEYEKSIFDFDECVESLLKNKINYKACLTLINENSPKNLKWLKELEYSQNITETRYKNSLRFPIEKVIIAEGATEETLLPEFAKRCGYDFDKEGVFVLSAGGKNQVVKLYYNLVEQLKLPIFVLLDSDAEKNEESIRCKQRSIDKIHLLKCGEFEDLLPLDLVKRTLEYDLNNISMMEAGMLTNENSMVKNLEEIFKTRGRHEFKKVEFAQMVKNNIKIEADISLEIRVIIEEIKNLNTKLTKL